MSKTKVNPSGLYLVIDPSVERGILLPKLEESLEAGVDMVQLWNHWPADWDEVNILSFIHTVLKLTSSFEVSVLINEAWQWLKQCPLDGVHFDTVPDDLDEIKREIGRDFMIGLTCGNELKAIQWAARNRLDYISFCSMFPSNSVDRCEIVQPQTVLAARKITDMPIFLSGGIKPAHIAQLNHLHFQGVAVISGIMDAYSPSQSIRAYKEALKNLKTIEG